MAEIAKTLAIETEVIIVPEAQPVAPTQIENVLVRDPAITHVGMVHCERSEEHTSELQSRLHLVCRLLLEKKKKKRRPILFVRSTQETHRRERHLLYHIIAN